jgi:hypothetical protein
MTTATDHEDAVRAALARRAATIDPPVPSLTALPAEPRGAVARPHRRRPVWLAAAAAVLLVAGAAAFVVARRDGDGADRAPDTRIAPAATLPPPPEGAVWPLTDDVAPAALAGPVRAARAYLAAMPISQDPVTVRLVVPPAHGRATVAYGTRPAGTISLRRVEGVWFVTGAASPAVTVGAVTRTGPDRLTVAIALRRDVQYAAGLVGLVDDTGTVVDLVTVTPGRQSSLLVAIGTAPGGAGSPPVRQDLPPRAAHLPCTCELHAPAGTNPAAVMVRMVEMGGGGSVAAVPVNRG